MKEHFEVLVVGFGAIGAVHARYLQDGGRCHVTAVARSSYESVRDHGLTFEAPPPAGSCSGWRPTHLVRTVEEAASLDISYDYIILSTKCLPDLAPTEVTLGPLLDRCRHQGSPLPTVVLAQNGLGIEHALAKAYPSLIILSCSIWSTLTQIPPKEDGEAWLVKQTSYKKLVVGLYDPTQDPFLDEGSDLDPPPSTEPLDDFVKLFNMAGGNAEASPLLPGRFQKILWSATFAVLCTLSRSSLHRLMGWDRDGDEERDPETWAVVQDAMEEVVKVARAVGLREDELGQEHIEKATSITMSLKAGTKRNSQKHDLGYFPSMTVDALAERPMESEVILGSVVRLGQKYNVPIPILTAWYIPLSTTNRGFIYKARR